MNKKKRQSMVLSDSDSESENSSHRQAKNSEKASTRAKPSRKKQKQHPETIFVESDGEASPPQSPSKRQGKAAGGANKQAGSSSGKKSAAATKSPKAGGPPAQKNTLDNYFSRLGGAAGNSAKPSGSVSGGGSSAAAASSERVTKKVNPADFFTSPPASSLARQSPTVQSKKASTAYAEDPDIIEASFVASPPRSARKSSASTAASSSDSRAKPGPAQHEKPLLTQQQQQRGSEGASAPQPPAGPEKSPLKRSATTPEAKRLSGMTIVVTGVLDYVEKEACEALLHQCGAKVTKSVSKRTSMLVVGREPGASKLDKAKQAGVRCCPEKEFYSFLCEKLGQPPEADPDDEAVEMMGVEPGAGTGAGADQRSNGSSGARDVERSGGGRSQAEERSGGGRSQAEERSGGGRSQAEERSGGGRSQAEERSGGGRSQAEERSGGGRSQAEERSGGGRSQAEERSGGGRSQAEERSGGGRSQAEERSGGGRSQAEERSGGGRSQAKDQREGGKAGAEGQPQQQLMWVDKYKPRSLKQIIGQSGPASCASKLVAWLSSWHRHLASGVKRGVAQPFQRFNNDGSALKAALLSGPPGIGKTTTATLACKELGFECLELNASDTRNKRSLHEIVGEALGTFSVGAMFGGGGGGGGTEEGRRRCIVMDEVDGMAGNEDRGGVAELIQLIKASQVPIICICNDRNHMKMRSLANYCFDLRFQRPRPEQIRAAAMSIASREGLKVDAQALLDVINASNNDVRQTIHNLQAWTSNSGGSSGADQLRKDASRSRKDLRFGPFDLVRKALSSDEMADKSINQLSDLFFQVAFPAWLGRNSTAGKSARQLSLLACHLRLASGGLASRDLGLDMAQHLAAALMRQDGADGVPGVIGVLEAYDLQREDMDSLLELTAWPGQPDAPAPAKRKAAASSAGAEEFDEEAADYGEGGGVAEEEAGSEEGEDADPTVDAMIKKPKKAAATKAKPAAATAGPAGSKAKSTAPAKGKKKK
uniref:Replication factor C subunit 1 n=1 Tax=Macrostomum lignano TaxID=282301 RepID=A0A1I8J9G4_9PLAT